MYAGTLMVDRCFVTEMCPPRGHKGIHLGGVHTDVARQRDAPIQIPPTRVSVSEAAVVILRRVAASSALVDRLTRSRASRLLGTWST